MNAVHRHALKGAYQVNNPGSHALKIKKVVGYIRFTKNICPLGSVIGLKLTTLAFAVTYKAEFQR
jgi:hypothetical protein